MRRAWPGPRPSGTKSPAPASSTPAPARARCAAMEAASDSAASSRAASRSPLPGEDDARVLGRLGLHLPHEQRLDLGARPPVDEARVVPRPVGAEVVEVVAAPAPAHRRGAGAREPEELLGRDRLHRREHEHLAVEHDAARLEEEPEGEAGGQPHAGQAVAPAGRQGLFPRQQPVAAGLEPRQIDEARRPAAREQLERDRVRGQPALAVGEHGAEERGRVAKISSGASASRRRPRIDCSESMPETTMRLSRSETSR